MGLERIGHRNYGISLTLDGASNPLVVMRKLTYDVAEWYTSYLSKDEMVRTAEEIVSGYRPPKSVIYAWEGFEDDGISIERINTFVREQPMERMIEVSSSGPSFEPDENIQEIAQFYWSRRNWRKVKIKTSKEHSETLANYMSDLYRLPVSHTVGDRIDNFIENAEDFFNKHENNLKLHMTFTGAELLIAGTVGTATYMKLTEGDIGSACFGGLMTLLCLGGALICGRDAFRIYRKMRSDGIH